MEKEVKDFVAACATCVQSKDLRQRPQGFLLPIPTPSRPWSHLTIDFVTGLPVSGGNSFILVIVDRFSKACKRIPLPKLPSALETAQIVLSVLSFWSTSGHRLGQRSAVFLLRLAGHPPTHQGYCHPVLWVPSAVQWPDRKGKPGDGGYSLELGW